MTLEAGVQALAEAVAVDVKALGEGKVDKVAGKGLSEEDFTTALRDKLVGLEHVGVEYYTPEGLVHSPKEFNAVVVANDGDWTCNYAIANFAKIHCIQVTAIASGTASGDRRIACISSTSPSLTECSGVLMSSTSAGLLVGMGLVNASGEVYVTVKGE